ncbi:GntR family transcriptional repressor for pyruvate dehydrogenase complex [Diaminobutyricimonas aerilata]|uniref:GntR family transcriptional repressor for pyruvate dehydrogenase complex n=1 Tax=Diaminobutyricimonas aerilata TaxID=1162967 RepID=A0A2M9CI05_9MICO|nr:FadR/GntR family transcriptional regulator [Diaminobutyricimonas aerilata]PJJ71518.1 GntR family transcriptional repressor for pyruvate dehydrogenase complex [Diaminobutyricimonas aerilata]
MPAYPGDSADRITAALGSVASGSAVSAVAKRLLDYFTSGDVAPGTRLPPERQLAASLGIGRSAVREALAALEILGIVDVRPGSGTYLRGNASELLPETLSWGMMLGEPRTRELIELRGQLEVFAARLAAERIEDRELMLLQRHLDAMRDNLHDRTRFIEADLKFHLQIGRSSRNTVLFDLLQSIRSLLRIWVERGLRDEEEARLAYEEHARVFEALTTRDPDAVAAAMGYHMSTAGARLARTIDS